MAYQREVPGVINLKDIIKEGLASCREVEAVRHVRSFYDLGTPQRLEEQTGYSVRVNHQGRLGFAYSEGQYSPRQMLQQAVAQATHGDLVDFTLPRTAYCEHSVTPKEWNSAIAQLRDTVRELRFALPILIPERSFVINAQLVRDSLTVANRWGILTDARLTYLISLRSHQGAPIAATHYGTALPSDLETILHQLCWRHSLSQRVENLDDQQVSAVFSPQAAGQFWQDFIRDVWADTPNEPWRPFGTTPALTIYEDGTLPGALGTTKIDGEGLPRHRVLLLQEGQPVQALHDVIGARRNKQTPAGTAVREWGAPPRPGFTNICVQAGTHTVSELCQEMGEGIWLDYLTPLTGQHQPGIFQRRANIAYLVQDGRPVARLPQLVIQGVFSDMLNQDFRGLGKVPQLFGRAQAPALAAANLHVFNRELSPQEESLEPPALWW